MKWEKQGLIFDPETDLPKSWTHASNPVGIPLNDQVCRFYFSSRDAKNRSHIFYSDIQLFPHIKVLSVSSEPVLSPGDLGLFDDSGVSLACIFQDGSDTLMYYLGWNLGVTVPWRNSIGLAKLEKSSGKFKKVSLAPVLDRNHVDPYSVSYPFVMKEGSRWRMWYGSNLRWGPEQKDMDHIIKYAESADGIHWNPIGEISIGIEAPNEYAFSRPFVRRKGSGYEMWYSFRGEAYRIGYAVSNDGIKFKRQDSESGISVSENGWDNEAISYPHIFAMGGQTFMVYNGNKFGKTGFGLATLSM